MFLWSLIELCTKEENNKTGWFFNYFDQRIKDRIFLYPTSKNLIKWIHEVFTNETSMISVPLKNVA